MTTVQDKVAEKIAQSGPVVMDRVVSLIADKEIKSRVDAVTQAVATVDNLQKDLVKINKNDTVNYSADGSKVEMMSEKRYNEIKKAKERISKLEAAISKALETNNADDFIKLSKAINAKPSDDKNEGGADSGAEKE